MRNNGLIKTMIIAISCGLLCACPDGKNPVDPMPNPRVTAEWHMPKSDMTVWQAMADNLNLGNNVDNLTSVRREINWYAARPAYVNQLTKNATPYIYYIYQQTRKRGLPAELALLPMIESNYNPFLYSRTGATGLWQMMPGTASGFGIKINWWYDGRRDVIASTNAALDYLTYLHDFFGNWLLAIAAYDSGEGTVENAIRYNVAHHRPTDFWDLNLPRETRKYVPKLLALAKLMRYPNAYRQTLYPVPNTPFLTTVRMTHQIAIKRAADLAGTTIKQMRRLNPGFRRWATYPHSSYDLVIPQTDLAHFENRLKHVNVKSLIWEHHIVQSGESLYTIAHDYKTNVKVVKQVNNLKTNLIHPGVNLLIPYAHKSKFASAIRKQQGSIAEDRLPGPRRALYIVRKYDTLWSIAARFGVNINQILYWNKLAHDKALEIGHKIVVWLPHHQYNFNHDYYTYHVRKGDSLDLISKRFNLSVASIKRYNDLWRSTIRIGEPIRIPRIRVADHAFAPKTNRWYSHRVRSGDSLWTIAEHYHVPVRDIIRWNHLKDKKYLHINETLKIYR